MSFEGTYGFSSLRRLSAMFSNTASIFAITSVFEDGWDEFIGGFEIGGVISYILSLAIAVYKENSRYSSSLYVRVIISAVVD